MRCPNTFKREFLKKWLLALQLCNHNKTNNNVLDRKKTIKLSAEIAIATARNGATCWSRALIAKAANSHDAKPFLSLITQQGINTTSTNDEDVNKKKKNRVMKCKKILKRSCGVHRRRRRTMIVAPPETVARRMARRKTEVLKKIVPGGEFISDDVTLIRETLDYMVSLRAQIDVMRSLVVRAAVRPDDI
ncbi:Transcription factor IBH1-like 1 [Linum perenne]